MSSGDNEDELIKFMFHTWRKGDPNVLNGVEVFVAHEESCYRLSATNGEICCSLKLKNYSAIMKRLTLG